MENLFGTPAPSVPVQIVHEAERKKTDSRAGKQVLATDVSIADTALQRLKGVMFERTLPPDYGLVFPFETARERGVHMLFVRVPIDVIWTVDRTVTAVKTLHPWTGFGRERADEIIELPAGAATRVSRGDRVEIRE